MIKHILKIIWNQRRSNVWIFMELLLVVAILWVMMDSLYVDIRTYRTPLGFDITNVYKVNFGKMSPDIPGYVPDELHQSSDGEDLIRLVDNLRQNPQVEEACLFYAACPYSWNTSWSSLIHRRPIRRKRPMHSSVSGCSLPIMMCSGLRIRRGIPCVRS